MEDVVDDLARDIVQDIEPEELEYFDEIKAEIGNNYKLIEEDMLQVGEVPELAWTAVALIVANELVQGLTKILVSEFNTGAREIAEAIRQFLTKKATNLINDDKVMSLDKVKVDRIIENALAAARRAGCTDEQLRRLEESLKGSFSRARS